jgi:hypothetical protein
MTEFFPKPWYFDWHEGLPRIFADDGKLIATLPTGIEDLPYNSVDIVELAREMTNENDEQVKLIEELEDDVSLLIRRLSTLEIQREQLVTLVHALLGQTIHKAEHIDEPTLAIHAKTYEIGHDGASPFLQCHLCRRRSYNENDITHRYCGYCHLFHGDLSANTPLTENPPP